MWDSQCADVIFCSAQLLFALPLLGGLHLLHHHCVQAGEYHPLLSLCLCSLNYVMVCHHRIDDWFVKLASSNRKIP